MTERDLICIMCPNGCHLHVDKDLNVTGNKCPRGVAYAQQEVTHPTRVVTSTVRINSKELRVCPVKTKDPIPKEKIFDIMAAIDQVHLKTPVHIGDVIIHDVCGTGIDVVATREILS
jgi:CxxC motif-containing protein